MTNLQVEITWYGLRLISEAPTGQPMALSRVLLMVPKPNDQKVNQVNLVFRNTGLANVGDVQRLTDGNIAVRVFLPYAEFPLYYQVLQTEKPVRAQVRFEGELKGDQTIPVQFAMLYVDEPVGEGPRDAQFA